MRILLFTALTRRPTICAFVLLIMAIIVFGILLTSAAPVPITPYPAAPLLQEPPHKIVISQIYGGGGNSGATYRNDYVELYNRGNTTVNLNGWTVQYASATGTTWEVTTLSGSLAPGHYYLIQQAQGAGGTQILPTPDAVGAVSMNATAGKVALLNGVGCLNVDPNGWDCEWESVYIVDLVGYGSNASTFEGTGPTIGLSNTTAISRGANGCIDLNDNRSDFDSGTPSPRNSNTAGNTCASTNPSTSVVISEFRTRGPNGGNDEFIELYNKSDAPVNISGWKIKGSSNTGSVSTRVTINQNVTLPSHSHFLVTNVGSSGYSGAVIGDQTYTVGISDNGGLALTRADDSIVDQVGMHAGSAFKEGRMLESFTINTERSYERKPGSAAGSGQDSDDNKSDFLVRTPSDPQNLGIIPSPESGVKIVHIDVGQGDATLIIGPSKTLLFDAGPTGTGPQIRAVLNSNNLNSLDYFVAGHYHEDHIGAIDELINSGIPINTASYDRAGDYASQAFTQYLNAVGTKRATISLGQQIDLGGGCLVTCVAVNGLTNNGGATPADENARSIALVVRFGTFDYFIASDLTGGGLNTTDVESFVARDAGDVDVLHVGHHGSSTSTNQTLVNTLHAEQAVISVGEGNSYGHPTQEVLNRLNTAAYLNTIWQTETGAGGTSSKVRVGGNVTFLTNGTTYSVSTSVDPQTYSFSTDGIAGTPLPGPQANAGGPYYGISGAPVLMNGSGSTDPNGTITSYQWNFGDGTSGTGVSTTHVFSTAGTYTIRLTVTDNNGAKASTDTTASIAPSHQPVANAGGSYSGASASAIQMNGSASYDSDGSIVSYQWDFGDNTTGTGPAPSHAYASAGTYAVTLTVTDNTGLTNTGTTTATIYPASNLLPVANIGGPYSTVTGTATQFSSGSFDPDGSITEYKWDFAGQGIGTGPTPSFTFTNTGTHLVSLSVTDNLGAKSWTSINVSVGVPPGGGQPAVGDSDVSDWDPFNRPSLDDPLNHRGNSANATTGNNNFQLVAPVLSLPGRGMDLNLNLVHNSLVWNKHDNNFYFDIDHDWPAPGWHLGFGKMVMMGTAGCLVIEPDGTRHSFKGTVFNQSYPATGFLPAANIPAFKGETTDGSMIEYRCEMQVGATGQPYGIARYPNGTVVFYTNYSTDFSKPKNYIYPYKIVDRNGNSISIKYLWDLAEPRLERVVDSVGRVISFRYDTQKRLTAITGPGLKDPNGNPTTYTFVRLHYSSQTLNLSGVFAGSTHVRNSSPPVLDAIYYPATGTGFWFGPDAYSNYGVLKKVTQQRGMSFSVSPSTPFEQGTVTQGTVTRIQTYDYPATPQNLSAAPTFNSISETWDGSGTSVVTNFVSEDNSTTNERTLTVTNPDETKAIQIAFSLNNLPDSDPTKFKNGLTKEERKLDRNGNVIERTVFTWEPGVKGSPCLQRTETTDERGQIIATAYDEYRDNNAVGRMREFDYSGAVFRTTVNTFISYLDADLDRGINPTRSPGNIYHPRLVNLVASTKVFQGDNSANVLASYVVSQFDDYPAPLKAYPADGESSADLFLFGESQQSGGIIGILQHVATFNPSPQSQSDLNGGFGENYLTKRGNVTSVTRYANTSIPSAPASPIVVTMKYDMAGNVISSSSACCEETSSNFDSLAHQYAFSVSQTRGSSDSSSLLRITTSASYDLSTGLPLSVTNANGRPIETTYFPNSLRPKEIVSPTGSRIIYEYDDAAMRVVETTRLSANGAIASQTTRYLNGLGQVKKEEALGANGAIDIVETLYDQFGRPSKQSLPYRTGQSPQWRETLYDAAGRLSEHREPPVPGTFQENQSPYPTTKYFYNESTRPAGASNEPGQTTRTVDAWDRWRWVRLDAAGRLAEVIEPNPAGGDGFATRYTYNALGKLIRSEQGDQVRRFHYDSIGRLTHQKLAEASATLNSAGEKATEAEMWSDVFTYDQRSNMTSHTDARGVKTILSYDDASGNKDPLNRLQSLSYDTSRVDSSLTVLPAASVAYQYRKKDSLSSLVDINQVEQVVADDPNTEVANDVSTEEFDYDPEGRLRERRFTFFGRSKPMTITYGYDNLGRINQTTYPEQYQPGGAETRKAITQTYDVSSRIESLQSNGVNHASQLTYNAASQITSVLIGSGQNQLTENYTYDDRTGLLATQSVQRGTATLMSYSYGYSLGYCDNPMAACDPDPKWGFHTGQLTKITNNTPGAQWQNQKFDYDELGRLKSAQQYTWIHLKPTPVWEQRTYWMQNYSYDRYGNRTAVAASSNTGVVPVPQDGLQSLTFDTNSNRITTAGFSYDPAGNQITNGTGQSFVYDAAGRLAKVKHQDGTTAVTYTYGASNHRLITQTGDESSSNKTYYIWNGDSVVAEYSDPSGAEMPQWSKNYIYLGGRLLATEEPNASAGEIVRYHHPDRLGTRLITNNVDSTYVQQNNLPFGTALDAEAAPITNRRFTSYDRSSTSGLDYAVNRQYDSRQGRFTQPDPLGIAASSLADPQSLNMYTYVGNDPVNRVDPDGQFWGALFRFIGGLFRGLRPNVINGSFAYGNRPPISVSFTTNFQNISIGYGRFRVPLRLNDQWLPGLLAGLLAPQNIQKLSPCLIDLLSPFFPGLDLTKVNIHTDGIPRLVQWFNTVQGGPGAVTWGYDVYFPVGTYNPNTNRRIAKLAHEIAHVHRFALVGKAIFARDYIKGYLNNIKQQMPSGIEWPFGGYLYDTTGILTGRWERFFEELRRKVPSIDFDRAYREIPYEQEAYIFEADFLRYLDEISEISGKSSPCP